jgi:hypothetical protein
MELAWTSENNLPYERCVRPAGVTKHSTPETEHLTQLLQLISASISSMTGNTEIDYMWERPQCRLDNVAIY